MGYTSYFSGSISVSPPLNEQEIAYLKDFSASRRMQRDNGPLYAVPGNDFGQDHAPDVRDYNHPAEGQPGLWCQWVPDEDGASIVWDEGEKFYNSAEWMKYIIDHLFSAEARTFVKQHWGEDLRFEHFTFNHLFNGEIDVEGEDSADRWQLVVQNNRVLVAEGTIHYDTPTPLN